MVASLHEQEALANSLLEQQKGIEAVKAFQTLIASNPPNTDWLYYQLGKAYSLDKKWAKAAESFMQALKLNPQLAIAAVAFGDASVAMKAYEEAEKAYLHALKFKNVHPELAQSYLRLGEILVNDKQYEFALHAYKNALGLDSGLRAQLVEIYKALADTLNQENKAELAQQVAEHARTIEEELAAEKAADEIDENELLLLQLHQVQEELETYFIKTQELETKLQDTESKLQDTESKLQDTESKLQDTESKLQDTESKLQDTESKLKQVTLKHDEQAKKVKELEKGNIDTTRQFAQSTLQLASLSTQLNQITSDRDAKTRLLQENNTKLHQVTKERDEQSTLIQKTEDTLAQILQNKTEHLDLWIAWASMAMTTNRYHEAIQRWQDIIAIYEIDCPSIIYQNLDEAYRKAGRFIAGTEEEEAIKGDADKHEILAFIHDKLNPSFYFEIGVQTGRSLALAKCDSIGIDPMPRINQLIANNATVITATSDNFFTYNANFLAQKRLDLVFIDGMHLFEFALRDFINVERYSNTTTLIVIDDIYPAHPSQAKRQRVTRNWTGDVWKLIPTIKQYRPDLLVLSLDADPTGLLFITGLNPDNNVLSENYDEIVSQFREVDEPPVEIIDRVEAISCDDDSVLSFIECVTQARENNLTYQALLDCTKNTTQNDNEPL